MLFSVNQQRDGYVINKVMTHGKWKKLYSLPNQSTIFYPKTN